MSCGLGPAYFLDGAMARPIPVMNQKGEQVWRRFEHVRLDRSQSAPSTNPIFVGSVSIQEVVNEALGELLRVTAVTFEDGAVNRPHRHTTDQVLIATSGTGFVATDDEHHSLGTGRRRVRAVGDAALAWRQSRHDVYALVDFDSRAHRNR